MARELEIVDETTRGEVLRRMTLVLQSESMTARALIERRVREEVDTFHRQTESVFRGLVQPLETERELNGYRLREHRHLDADAQVARALEAFGRNEFFLLVGDRQLEELDEEIVLLPGVSVTFIKLVPLVGG